VIVVQNEANNKVERIEVKVNGFVAQQCSFPFEYKNVTYSACTNIDQTFSWCSPYPIFNGQILKCANLSKKFIFKS
jgi:hypothetical protein